MSIPINAKRIYTTFLYFKHNELENNPTPSPAGKGWGEENKINYLYPPRQLLLHCSTSCIHAVVIPAFSLKGEGAGTCVDTYALMPSYWQGRAGIDNAAITVYQSTVRFLDY